jgi:hypothetical protein
VILLPRRGRGHVLGSEGGEVGAGRGSEALLMSPPICNPICIESLAPDAHDVLKQANKPFIGTPAARLYPYHSPT